MVGQAHREGLTGEGLKLVDEAVDDGRRDSIAPGNGPCMNPACSCCGAWADMFCMALTVAERLAGVALDKAEDNSGKEQTIQTLQATKSALDGEISSKEGTICCLQASEAVLADINQKLAKANKDLNAKANKINVRTVPDRDRKSTGRVGRPPGQKPTRNTRPKPDKKVMIDIQKCPEGHALSDKVSDTYTRAVKVTTIIQETVEYTINRRWCRECGKMFHNDPPGVAPHARVSTNHSAAATALNMSGLSHGKTAEFCNNLLKGKESRSWSYRNKNSAARRLAPEHARIKKEILQEPYLQCDEVWWRAYDPRKQDGKQDGKRKRKSSGAKLLVARGDKNCLVEAVWSANIDAVKKMLPKYKGKVGQDSNPIWMHVGCDRQFCMQHQRRLSKKDLKYLNLQGDPVVFLTELRRLDYLHHVYHKIEDPHTRMVAARCLEKKRSDLLHEAFTDDTDGTIARRKKRHKREGQYMTLHMYDKNVDPDSNKVERVNRLFKSIRSDGGGNRSQKGMDTNSILFTIMATDWINKNSFFDHLMRSASGISTPENRSASGDG